MRWNKGCSALAAAEEGWGGAGGGAGGWTGCEVCGMQTDNTFLQLHCYSTHLETVLQVRVNIAHLTGETNRVFTLVPRNLYMVKNTVQAACASLYPGGQSWCEICCTELGSPARLATHTGALHLLVNDILVERGLAPVLPAARDLQPYLTAVKDRAAAVLQQQREVIDIEDEQITQPGEQGATGVAKVSIVAGEEDTAVEEMPIMTIEEMTVEDDPVLVTPGSSHAVDRFKCNICSKGLRRKNELVKHGRTCAKKRRSKKTGGKAKQEEERRAREEMELEEGRRQEERGEHEAGRGDCCLSLDKLLC